MRILFLSFLFLTACVSAEFVEKNFEPTKSGVIKYKREGAGAEDSLKKADAMMISFCAPEKPTILQERYNDQLIDYRTDSIDPPRHSGLSRDTTLTPETMAVTLVRFQCR